MRTRALALAMVLLAGLTAMVPSTTENAAASTAHLLGDNGNELEVTPGTAYSTRLTVVNDSIIGIYYRFKDIPEGATVTLRLRGCHHKVVKRFVVKEAGSYKKNFVIMRANEKFGKTVETSTQITKDGYAPRRFQGVNWDVSRAGWHCRS